MIGVPSGGLDRACTLRRHVEGRDSLALVVVYAQDKEFETSKYATLYLSFYS